MARGLWLAAAVVVGPAIALFCDAVTLQVTDATPWGSSDPAGLTLLPDGNLLLVDSEVEETPFWTGANAFVVSPSGTLLASYSTLGFSKEPTGVVYSPHTETLFFTDDNLLALFECTLGQDGLTLVNAVSLGNQGIADPEGITVDPSTGNLWIAGGGARLVYELTPMGTLVSAFEVAPGAQDPEGITFDARSRTLWVVSGFNRRVFEHALDGTLLGELDLQPIRDQYGIILMKGMALGPPSGFGATPEDRVLYLADYGWDEQLDGRLFEVEFDDSPLLDAVPQATLAEGETLSIPLTGFDPDGDTITYEGLGLPAFVTLQDAGDGTAALLLAPAQGDAGSYEFLVSGTSGPCSRFDVIAVSVEVTEGVFNEPPVVDAGPNIKLTNVVGWIDLEGTVTDDGLPDGVVDVFWEIVSGPAGASLTDPNSLATQLMVVRKGLYVLRLTADDGELSASDDVRVRIRQK